VLNVYDLGSTNQRKFRPGLELVLFKGFLSLYLPNFMDFRPRRGFPSDPMSSWGCRLAANIVWLFGVNDCLRTNIETADNKQRTTSSNGFFDEARPEVRGSFPRRFFGIVMFVRNSI